MTTGASTGQKKNVTIKDVAQQAGVSVPTVSRVLAGNYPVAAATRARVLRAMRDLDYVVNAHARALAGATAKTVAFVLRDIASPFFTHIAHGVETQATAEGRLSLVCSTNGDAQRELAVVDLMREQRSDAVILVGGGSNDPAYRERMIRTAHALDAVGSRLVLCGRPSLGEDVPATVVQYDNYGGAYAATSHLLSLGHRRITFIGLHPEIPIAEDRYAAFDQAHEAFDVEIDPELIVPGTFDQATGRRAVTRLLDAGAEFTAVVAANDTVAVGAIEALRQAGRDVPGEVSVIGYDDIPLAAAVTPGLTTVHVPHEALGRAAVYHALHRDNAAIEQHVTLATHVVVRSSVAPPRMRRNR